MIKLEDTQIFGWEAAIRGMRNPKNSWAKSDSGMAERDDTTMFSIGENDMRLMQTLSRAGTDHGKFLRMIVVYADITAPLYWWKEFDTYKVGTVTNSCSTMHKIHAKEFTLDDFSHEHLISDWDDNVIDGLGETIAGIDDENCNMNGMDSLQLTIRLLNAYREKFLETKDKAYWWQLIQLLPSSYNQKRTVMLNYAVLKNMYHARKAHKLDEWHDFCAWAKTLPYFKELCIDTTKEEK